MLNTYVMCVVEFELGFDMIFILFIKSTNKLWTILDSFA